MNNPHLKLQRNVDHNKINSPILFELCWLGLNFLGSLKFGLLLGSLVVVRGLDGGGLRAGFFSSEVL